MLRLCQGADIGAIYSFEVIAARRAKFYGELSGAGMGELLPVDARFQAVALAGFEDLFCLRHAEGAALAENVAEFGEFFGGDQRDYLIDEKRDVFFGAGGAATEFSRDHVRAEKSGNDVQWLRGGQFFMQVENFELADDVEAVAALGLDSGSAVGGELLQRGERSLL